MKSSGKNMGYVFGLWPCVPETEDTADMEKKYQVLGSAFLEELILSKCFSWNLTSLWRFWTLISLWNLPMEGVHIVQIMGIFVLMWLFGGEEKLRCVKR